MYIIFPIIIYSLIKGEWQGLMGEFFLLRKYDKLIMYMFYYCIRVKLEYPKGLSTLMHPVYKKFVVTN